MLSTVLKNEKLMSSFWQLARFGVVGVGATLTQFVVALVLSKYAGIPLLIANPVAFAVAFGVSFSGHHFWTFPGDTSAARNLWRFLIVALCGFGVSELLLLLLVHYGVGGQTAKLVLSTLVVPPVTFVLGKLWAFAG